MATQHQVELTHFASSFADCPPSKLPEVAISGRSNVGKSSLVNLLIRRKKMAYTSKQPGKTQCFIYFTINEQWNLVDMPGYGYARVNPQMRRQWAQQAKQFFHKREQLSAVIQLIDMKVGPTPDDRNRVRELITLGKPICLVMTKGDKIPRSQHEEAIVEHLKALAPLPPQTGVVLSSALEKYGAGEIWAWIADHLASSGKSGEDSA